MKKNVNTLYILIATAVQLLIPNSGKLPAFNYILLKIIESPQLISFLLHLLNLSLLLVNNQMFKYVRMTHRL